MRYLSLLILFACLVTTAPAQAHEVCHECNGPDGYTSAYHALEKATLEQRYYRRIEHPAQVRILKAEIQFSEARVETLRRAYASYRPFTRFGTGNPLTLSVERTRLDLLREELCLRELREQLRLENRFHRQRMQHYAYKIQASVARLSQANFDATEPQIKIVSHTDELPQKN